MLRNRVFFPLNSPTTDVVVMGGNMRRRALAVSINNGFAYVSIGGPSIVNGVPTGFEVHSGTSAVWFRREDVGDAIHEDVHASGGAVSTNLVLEEYFDN